MDKLEEQKIASQLKSIERNTRQLNVEARRLEALLDNSSPMVKRPKRYNVEMVFEPGSLLEVEASFSVDKGTRFYPVTVGSSFRVVGTVREGTDPYSEGDSAQITLGYGNQFKNSSNTLPETSRQAYFDFLWTVNDTSQDADWQNVPVPSVCLMTGRLSALDLPRGYRLEGGSALTVSVQPIYSVAEPPLDDSFFFSVSNYIVAFTFEGFEVLL